MVKHIVLWKLKETAGGRTRTENAAFIKRELEALRGVVSGLIRIEVGFDFSASESSSDLALYSEFESRAALDAYQSHPAHQDIVAFLKTVRTERRVVDYEV